METRKEEKAREDREEGSGRVTAGRNKHKSPCQTTNKHAKTHPKSQFGNF
jgi:hypothetical protein